MQWERLIRISRPRFWMYVFGPLVLWRIIGLAEQYDGFWEIRDAVATIYQDPHVVWYTIVACIYFLLPANLLIYGVNDISDYETDILNDKKWSFEEKVEKESFGVLQKRIIGINVPFVLVLWYLWVSRDFFSIGQFLLVMWGFIFTSVFYSFLPIRAKSKPFVDGLFNILYGFSSVFGRVLVGNAVGDFAPIVIMAWVLFFMAWHAFSAVPDIIPDRQAGLLTTAVLLWEKLTLWYCLVLRLISFLLVWYYLWYWSLLGIWLFCGFCVLAMRWNTYSVYKWIPWTIPIIGTVYFWVVLLMH